MMQIVQVGSKVRADRRKIEKMTPSLNLLLENAAFPLSPDKKRHLVEQNCTMIVTCGQLDRRETARFNQQ
ncbi:MAG: hypothetical protein NTAFB01_28720 [Nitrospira sp.]